MTMQQAAMTETALLGTRLPEPVRPARRLAFRVALPAIALAAFLAVALGLVATTPFPGNDELEHVSYAAHLQETGRLLPQFELQRTLRRDDFSTWDDRPNYIGHPSPFYVLVARVLDRQLPPGRAVLAPRLLSLLLLACGVGLALAAGARAVRRDRLALGVTCLAIAACPELLTVSAMVTNDSLAVLGGALACWGLAARPRQLGHDVAAGAGLMLALWAKPNAGLEVGLMLAAMLALHPAGRGRLALAGVLGGCLGAAPTLPILLTYGAVVPVTAEGVWLMASVPEPAEYLPVFLLNLGNTWGFLRTGAWPLPGVVPALTAGVVAAMLACAGHGAWRAWRLGRPPVAAAGMIAFLAVLPVHYGFAATRLGGSIPAASFRYDLPLWPALALGLGSAVMLARRPWQRAAAAGVTALAIAVGWLPT